MVAPASRVAAFLLTAHCSLLTAQQPDSTRHDTTAIEIAPIEVIGSIAPTARGTIGSGIPARISTVDADAIEASEPRLLADALASQPGVSTYDDLGSPYKLSLSTRGFTVGPVLGTPQGVSVFLDGVRQNEPDAAEVNFDLLPMEHIKRVELLSGTASLLGPNSLGGAINLISRRGEGPLAGELEVSAGSYDNYGAEGSLGARTGSGWDYYLGAGYGNEKGWRQATGAQSYNGFINLGRQGNRGGWRLQASGARSEARAAGSLPESIFDSDPRLNFTPGDFENLDQFQGSLSGYRDAGSSRVSLTVFGRRTNAERFNVNQAPDPDVRAISRNRTVGGTFDWRWTRPTATGSVSLRLGVDGARNSVLVEIHNESAGTDTLSTDVKSPSWDLAGYGLADFRAGRVTLSAGARYDYVRIPFRDLLDPSADTTSGFRRLSPRAGASVELGAGFSAYASWGQSFRAPSLLELTCADETAPCPLPFALGDDPPLKPVIARTGELGGRAVVGNAILSGSVYRTEVHDDIYFISGNLVEGFFSNIGNTRREGVELGAQLLLEGGHTLYASYAHTRASFQTAARIRSVRADAAPTSPLFGDNAVTAGDRLPLVPEHQLRAGASLRLPAGVATGADLRWVGRQWLRGDEANQTMPLDSYFTTDLRLGWSTGAWGVSGLITNLFNTNGPIFGTFNQNRVTGEVERFLGPAQHRSFKVVVKREFGGARAVE